MRTYYNIEVAHDWAGGRPMSDGHVLRTFPDGRILAAVIDTHDQVYSPRHPPRLVGGVPGDLMVLDVIRSAFYAARRNTSLREIAIRANLRIRGVLEAENGRLQEHGKPLIPLDDPAELPGAVMAAVIIDPAGLAYEMLQTCDAWVIKYGGERVEITPFRNAKSEIFHQRAIRRLIGKHNLDKGAMWDDFYHILRKSRQRNNANGNVVIANGTGGFDRLIGTQITSGRLNGLETIAIGSDGAFPDKMAMPGRRLRLARKFAVLDSAGGSNEYLKWAREIQKQAAGISHVCAGLPEATILAIRPRQVDL